MIKKGLRKIYHKFMGLRQSYLTHVTYKAEIRNITKKEPLYSKVHLTEEQENEIKSYWKEISGYDISTKWHRLYQSYMGIYEKKYFPEILYSTKLEPLLSPAKYHGILSDKGFLSSIFCGGGYRLPENILWNCNGVFTDKSHFVIDRSVAEGRLGNCGKAIIKPTVDTSSGEGVRLLNMIDGIDELTHETAKKILEKYGYNYVVQECVVQSELLSKIYSKSLNTFRIITYIFEGSVYHAPVAMRIGSGGSYIDNIHAGGLCIGITKDYKLRKYAFTEMGIRFEKHPDSGVVFEGYEIRPLKNVVEIAERLHGLMPQIKMISWDWSIDRNNVPIMVEVNISGQAVWFPQMLNGEPIFGEHTEYFANLIRE